MIYGFSDFLHLNRATVPRMNQPSLSIVIGALREEKRIDKTLDGLAQYLESKKLMKTTEVIVVAADGGDNTKKHVLTHSHQFNSLRLIEPGAVVGKGRDIRDGMLAARGKVRLFMDADLATPLHHISTVVDEFAMHGVDIVIGTRFLPTLHKNIFRRMISIIGNICFLLVSGQYISDTQCGFKAFSADATETCFKRLTRMHWSFDMELLVIAQVHRLKIKKIPITDWRHIDGGTFSGSLGNSYQFLKDLVRMFSYRLNGRYR